MDEALKQLEKVIPKKDLLALQDILIFQEDDGVYNVYGKYLISKNNQGTYSVSVLGTYTEKSFFKLKNAVSWCSYDKRNLIRDARRVHQLDQMIYGIDTEIKIHTDLMKKTKDMERKLICLSKLSQERVKKRVLTTELSLYLNNSSQWQHTKFAAKPNY